MSREENAYDFSYRDLLVFVPLLTSTIALCWQVGMLAPARPLFLAFSLSDHLVAAATAIPASLAIVSYLTITTYGLKRYGAKSPTVRKLVMMFLATGPIALAGGLGLAWWLGYMVSAVVLVPAIAWFLCFAALNILTRSLSRSVASPEGLVTVFGSAAILSLSFAWASSVSKLRRVDLGMLPVATIVTKKAGVFTGYPLMSGERGVLTYDPASQAFKFTRADEIISIELLAK